jgi:hypothetical protein
VPAGFEVDQGHEVLRDDVCEVDSTRLLAARPPIGEVL